MPRASGKAEPANQTAATDLSQTAEPTAAQEAAPKGELGNRGFQNAMGLDAPLLIAEDSATELTEGQMRRSEFLDALHTAVCATADEALAGSGLDSQGCPWVEYWFGYYNGQDAVHVERALRKYAPEAAAASSAADYIATAAARVRASVDLWLTTGEITGLPEGVPMEVPEEGGGAAPAMFFKARPGGARPGDPREVQRQLGDGEPLGGGVRSRMETALGADLSGVRIHTGGRAAALSDRMNARAFTVGKQVAFGAGEYQPGTLVGDALLAHELAHTVQQGGEGKQSYGDLEADADRSALGVLGKLWSGGKAALNVAGPRLRSGLQLSRCSKPSGPAPGSKSVTVNMTLLSGNSADVDAYLKAANEKVYNQADITIKTGSTLTLDDAKSKAILGDDLILQEYKNPANPTAEEQNLLKENQSGGAIPAYFVKGMTDSSQGESFWPALGGPVGFAVSNGAVPSTFAHELGHILLDSGSHNVPDATYLMTTTKDAYKLGPDEIKTIKSSKFVT